MAGAITSLFNEGGIAGGQAAGTVVCTLSKTVLTQKGNYRITVIPTMGTGAAAGDAGNMQIVVGGSTMNLPVAAVSGPAGTYPFYVNLDGNTDVVLKVGAGGNTAPYSGIIIAEYAGPNGARRF